MTAVQDPFEPIIRAGADKDNCWLGVEPSIMEDPVQRDRLKLMLAAVFDGVRVFSGPEIVGYSADMLITRDDYIGSMTTITPAQLNKRLGELKAHPVLLLTRGPKPMQWLLVLTFRAGGQHLDALRRIEMIEHAVRSTDPLYDGKMVELFVPESSPTYEPAEGDEQVAGDGLRISHDDLLKQIEATLDFALAPIEG